MTASERLKFKSRMCRLNLSCSRWKTFFQREMHADLSIDIMEK